MEITETTTLLDLALDAGTEHEINHYLSNVEVDEFLKDIEALKKRYADKGAIQEAVTFLQKFL